MPCVEKTLTFAQRAEIATHPFAKKLFLLMEEKKSNLCSNPDVTSSEELLAIADQIGPEISLLKTHIDILEDFTPEIITELQKIADKHRFFIFEDRKFCDIGSTVQLQYAKGIYHIADWAHLTNAHIAPGPGIIEALREIGLPKERALLLLAQMSSKGAQIDQHRALELANAYPDFVIGFICQEKLSSNPGHLHLTPGVSKKSGGDNLGQQFNTPETIIGERGSDMIIVGRAIYRAENPAQEAKIYRELAWEAYQKRVGSSS